MSYNIDTWRTKHLDNFVLSLAALYECSNRFDDPVLNLKDETITIEGGAEVLEITGRRDGDALTVTEITCYGEGSGNTFHDVLVPVFKRSTGTLIASCVWEGGDSITRLTVKDGVVTEEPIEI